eukprot:TRINITY_DN87778_c0_g1_i1.p1 TRINITY_DN87778_c0_g1~~TRINITY_DN87778_c0_g1_i1.p1  ORF type:complete len:624 (+),score=94.53 TRINITY_DN87778_c0_g1_i1:86-1957(+)
MPDSQNSRRNLQRLSRELAVTLKNVLTHVPAFWLKRHCDLLKQLQQHVGGGKGRPPRSPAFRPSMCEAHNVCAPLAALERVLHSASESLHEVQGEVAALQAENERLRQSWGSGKLQLEATQKPAAPDTCTDSPEFDDPGTDIRSNVDHSQASQSQGGEREDDTISKSSGSGDVEPIEISLRTSSVPRPLEKEYAVCSKRSLSMESLQQSVTMFQKTRPRAAWAEKLWTFLDDPESSCSASIFSKLLDPLLHFSVILSVLQTTDPAPLDSVTFDTIQMSIDLFFLAELIVRLYVCPSFYFFVRSFYNITDFVAGALPLSLRFAQIVFDAQMDEGAGKYLMFCVAPVLRELKMLRRVQQFFLFLRLLEDVKEALQLLMMLLTIVVLVFASLLWAVEPAENIGSMPKAMYLTIVTVTTVGYGDITPKSTAGICVISVLTMFSILYTAMPIGIIGNAFTQIWQDRDRILLMIKTRDILVQSGYTAKDLPSIFRAYDSSGEGQLYFDEFFLMVQDMKLGLTEQRAVEVFESVDRDGGGTIDEQEFVRLVFPGAYHELYKKQPGVGGKDAENLDDGHDGFWRQISGASRGSNSSKAALKRKEKKEEQPKRRKSVRSIGSGVSSHVSSDQ